MRPAPTPLKIGSKYNYWTVKSYIGSKPQNRSHFYRCECKCGTIRDVASSNLITKRSKSCGCIRKVTGPENGKKSLLLLTPGTRLGYYEILNRVDNNDAGHTVYSVKCHSCNSLFERERQVLVKIRGTKCQHPNK